MLEFMDWVQSAFYTATGWNRENSYSNLNATGDAILGFETPRGIRVTLSSLVTPHFATSYQLGTVGIVDGSVAYLYSNVPLGPIPRSEKAPLQDMLCSYRMLTPLQDFRRIDTTRPFGQTAAKPEVPLVVAQPRLSEDGVQAATRHPRGAKADTRRNTMPSTETDLETPTALATMPSPPSPPSSPSTAPSSESVPPDTPPTLVTPSPSASLEVVTTMLSQTAKAISTRYRSMEWTRDSMMYGRMYLPHSQLEALVLRRITSTIQGQVRAVSQESIKNGGTILGLLQYDTGKFGLEGLASSDGGVLGLRGLYNFGGDSNSDKSQGSNNGQSNGNSNESGVRNLSDRIYGRSSVGAEIYYGTLNKSGGMSVGARFSTLPTNLGIPLTATAMCNPLMGNVSCTYAVRAGKNASIASRFDWNVYSYESDWGIGVELWRKREIKPFARSASQQEWEQEHDDEGEEGRRGAFDEPDGTAPETLAWRRGERSRKAKLEWKTDEDVNREEMEAEKARLRSLDPHIGVLKARLDQHWRVGLIWEGRAKSLLFSIGTGIDLRRLDQPFRTLGLEVSFSS